VRLVNACEPAFRNLVRGAVSRFAAGCRQSWLRRASAALALASVLLCPFSVSASTLDRFVIPVLAGENPISQPGFVGVAKHVLVFNQDIEEGWGRERERNRSLVDNVSLNEHINEFAVFGKIGCGGCGPDSVHVPANVIHEGRGFSVIVDGDRNEKRGDRRTFYHTSYAGAAVHIGAFNARDVIGGNTSDIPQFVGRPPQEAGRNRQDHSEGGRYSLAMTVEKIGEPNEARKKRAIENAAIFYGVIIGGALIAYLLAGKPQ
jgi:hypothetical protein